MQIKTVLPFIVLVSGCTALESHRVNPSSDTMYQGIVYHLPQAQFEIALTRELTSCDPDTMTENVFHPVVETSVEVKDSYVADPGQQYVIDYSELNGPTKVTELTVDRYPNGTLKSINGNIDDRTQQITGNFLRGAVSVAKMVAFGPKVGVVVPYTGSLGQIKSCTKAATDALHKKAIAERELARLAKELIPLDEQIATRENAIAKGDRTAKRQTPSLELLFSKRAQILKRVSERKDEVAKAKEVLVDKEVLHWPRRGADFGPCSVYPSKKLVNRWFVSGSIAFILSTDTKICELASEARGGSEPLDDLMVSLRLDAMTAAPTNEGTNHGETIDGIVYRQPGDGRLTICRGNECQPNTRLFSQAYRIPQLGVLARLSLRNRIFDKNNISATFEDSGALKTLTFGSEASAERASAVLAEMAETAKTIPQAQAAAKKEAADARNALIEADTKRLTALRDKLKMQTELRNLGREEVSAAEIEELETEIKLLELRKRKAEAQHALDEATSTGDQ